MEHALQSGIPLLCVHGTWLCHRCKKLSIIHIRTAPLNEMRTKLNINRSLLHDVKVPDTAFNVSYSVEKPLAKSLQNSLES